ncbi:MAG: methyltransferase domain-containing protein, partial [Thermodesulfobacteriota bacterium]
MQEGGAQDEGLTVCPLCGEEIGNHPFHRDRNRDYYRCTCCGLTHVPPRYHLSPSEERQEYEKHQNSSDDEGYRRFLSRLFVPLNNRLRPTSKGLDFGSGPGPTLSVMFEEAGHRMQLFDPFFADNRELLAREYDFVTASEVVEHFRDPAADL